MTSLAEITSTLWPRGNYSAWLVSGARQKALIAYGINPLIGQPYDVGALRNNEKGIVEVRTPVGWKPYSQEYHFIASVFNRVGPGWSFSSNSVHNAARGWFEIIYHRRPSPMESVDIQFNKALYETLRRIAVDGSNETPPVFGDVIVPSPLPVPTPLPAPVPLPVPVPDPIPPVPAPIPVPQPTPPVSSPPLSPASIRVEEIRSMAKGKDIPGFLGYLILPSFWDTFTKPIAIELLKTYRLLRKFLGDTREIPKE